MGETVCSSATGGLITSGGGFSYVSVRSTDAPWQAELVDHYLAYNINNTAVLPPTTYFNTKGRGYPDVSAYASNYFVYLNGKVTRESGTSASAPVFAAMVTLWNDMRLAYGKPPLGFIAPLMYHMYVRHPEAFNDITTGDNACGVGHSSETVNCCQVCWLISCCYYFLKANGSILFLITFSHFCVSCTYHFLFPSSFIDQYSLTHFHSHCPSMPSVRLQDGMQ